MTKEEALQIPDLCIEVDGLTEDAFYAFRDIDDKELQERLDRLPDDYVSGDSETDALMDKYFNDIEMSENARRRFDACPDPKLRYQAYINAMNMKENIQRYGVPCAEWCD